MKKEDRRGPDRGGEEERREAFNLLGRQYCDLRNAGREDEALNLSARIFEEVDALFGSRLDWEDVSRFYLADWPKFDADRGDLYGFFSSRLKLRQKDQFRKDEKKKDREKELKPDDGPGAHGYEQELPLLAEETAVEFMTLLLQLPERLTGQARNADRITYFRMFFTDSVVLILHTMTPPDAFLRRERDLFSAMKTGFLDFFMAARCRKTPEIAGTPLKKHGELVPGKPMEEPDHPLPTDIYIAYLREEGVTISSPGTISNQRGEYKKFLKEHLC